MRGGRAARPEGGPAEPKRGGDLSNFTADVLETIPGPGWLKQRRREAFERFAAASLPSESDEVWRYSRVDELDLDAFGPVREDGTAAPPAGMEGLLEALGPKSGLLVAVDGKVVHEELGAGVRAGGASFGGAAGLAEEPPGAGPARAPDALVELNGAFVRDVAALQVPARVSAPDPFVIVNWVASGEAGVFPRTLVRLGEEASANVLEVVASADLRSVVVPVVDLEVADGAELSYTALQTLGPRVWQLSYQSSRVGRDARLQSFNVGMGGDYARVRTDSALVGRKGLAQLSALYFGDGGQVHDFRTLQDHDAPKTTSELVFKGAVKDHSRSVYSGLIRIQPGAVGSDAIQTNRNLVLSEGAHADSVPNLDIAENDVRCSHASAVGPIDEEQRYYLESRGLPPAVADRLIVQGFFDDVLDRVAVAPLRSIVRSQVRSKLASVRGPDGLLPAAGDPDGPGLRP